MSALSTQAEIGPMLRRWRERRRFTQLELALDARVSTRHLSFIETGRSSPGRETLLRIMRCLDLPLREQNVLLLTTGHAPAFPERALDDPDLAPVREALEVILTGHEPNPAVVVDRAWNLVAANATMAALAGWADPALLEPPINVMRLGLHPRGLARWIVNLGEVRAYFLGRLRRQLAITGSEALSELLAEVSAYPAPEHEHDPVAEALAGHILTPLMQMRGPDGVELSFFATVATFGTAAEVTASELSIELAFAADAATTEALRRLRRS
jgi:transcriptional regulator with XRE-family HTH domain